MIFRFLAISMMTLLLGGNIGCTSGGTNDDDSGNGNGNQDPVATYSGTLDGVETDFELYEMAATTEADGGVLLTMTGTANNADLLFTIDVSGGAQIDIPTEGENPEARLPVGSGNELNVAMVLSEARYRGTSGNLFFSAYDPMLGGAIEGRCDLGLVRLTDPQTGPSGVTIAGDFSLNVVVPTPTPTPTEE